MSSRISRRVLLAGAAAAAVPLFWVRASHAGAPPKLDVMVLHGLKGAAPSIDPAIVAEDGDQRIRRKLGEAPLSAYNIYNVLARKELPLVLGSPVTMALPNERKLVTTFVGELGKGRFKLSSTIVREDGSPFLKNLDVAASAREPVIVGGQSYKDGTLVLVMRLVESRG